LVVNIFGYGSVLNQLRSVLGIYISEERNMFVAENFIRSHVSRYGKHTVYTDGGTCYPQACTFLHLKHRFHPPLEKSLIERVLQYFKDRTECFDDYYPCFKRKKNCDLQHAYNWIKLFIYLYNAKIRKEFLFNIGGEILKLTSMKIFICIRSSLCSC
jgi:putative transposase